MRARRALAMAVLIAPALLGACGGSGSSPASPTSAGGGGDATTAPDASGGGETTTAPTKSSSIKLDGIDACSLLAASDVAPLVPQPTSNEVPRSGPQNEHACHWEEGGSGASHMPATLLLTILELPAETPGLSYSQAIEAEAKDANNKAISGLGDAALVGSAIPANAEAKVLLGNVVVTLEFSDWQPDGVAHQDDVVALVRKVVAKLA
jgi:hypothetical protein